MLIRLNFGVLPRMAVISPSNVIAVGHLDRWDFIQSTNVIKFPVRLNSIWHWWDSGQQRLQSGFFPWFQKWNLLFASFWLQVLRLIALRAPLTWYVEIIDSAFLFLVDGSGVEFDFGDGHVLSFRLKVPDLANIDMFWQKENPKRYWTIPFGYFWT